MHAKVAAYYRVTGIHRRFDTREEAVAFTTHQRTAGTVHAYDAWHNRIHEQAPTYGWTGGPVSP